eukprot:g3070.t1
MDVLSAATETVANADAMEAAAMKATKLPTGPTPPTATAAAAAAADAAAAPDTAAAAAAAAAAADTTETTPAATSRAESSEMDVDEGAAPPRVKDNGAPPPPAVLPAVRAAHEALLKNAEDIKSGEHPKMKEDIEAQGKLKRARLESAKKNSQLMDTNIQELGDAELRDSQVQTKVDLERTQDELLDDVHQRIRKAKVDGGLVPPNPSKAAASTGGIAAKGVGEGSDKDKDKIGGGLLLGKKRARLLPEQPFEKVTPEAVLAKAEARRVRTVTLSDIEMRRDFQAIIADWRDRAKNYLSTYNNSHWTKVTVSQDSFRVRGETFSRGDPVVVTSRVTREEFHGEITVVKPKMVFLSLYGGVKTRIFVDHISTGRLTVARADAKTSVA